MVEKRRNTRFRQKQIVAAAAELIVRHGSEHLTIKSIARRTKLSEAAIYRHFSSKNDIFHFLLEHIEMTLLTDLRRGDSRNRAGVADIDSLIDTHISEIEKSRGVEFQVIAEIISMGNVALNQETLGIINRYISGLKEIFHRRINSKYFKSKPEAECLALAFFTLLQGLVNLWALSGYTFDLKRKFYRVWAVYTGALGFYTNPRTLAKDRNLK
jgi:AcrR family transcriptional regulator